ncbi:hypothetical protein PENTCL1PPCAC_11367, partial [Pristionchus entomophagus]
SRLDWFLPFTMIILLLVLFPFTVFTIGIGCAMKSTKPSTAPQFQFTNSSKSTKETPMASEATQKSSHQVEEPTSGRSSGSKEGSKGGSKGGETSKKEKAPIIYTPKRVNEPKPIGSCKIMEPKINELNEKEKAIAAGAKKERNEYPTFDDVHSDWEGPLGEMHGGVKKEVETQ